MRIYLAGIEAYLGMIEPGNTRYHEWTPGWAQAVDGAWLLTTYYAFRHRPLPPILSKHPRLILDSGAFSFAYGAHGGTSERELTAYADAYADFVRVHHVERYIELDVDNIIGIQSTRRLRDRIENRVGWQSLPVWHSPRGRDAWETDTRDYGYVAIGGIARARRQRKYLLPAVPWLIDRAHDNGALVHGLGFTAVRAFEKGVPRWDSADSTTWLNGGKYGFVYHFDGHSIHQFQRRDRRMKKNASYAPSFLAWAQYGIALQQRYPEPFTMQLPTGYRKETS